MINPIKYLIRLYKKRKAEKAFMKELYKKPAHEVMKVIKQRVKEQQEKKTNK